MDTLDVDDLYRCAQCGAWHPLYVKYPEGPKDDEAIRLYFDCRPFGRHAIQKGLEVVAHLCCKVLVANALRQIRHRG